LKRLVQEFLERQGDLSLTRGVIKKFGGFSANRWNIEW
jgi:hypothetical protein